MDVKKASIVTGLIIAALMLACLLLSALPRWADALIEKRANDKAQTIQAQADAAIKYAAVRQMDVATQALENDVKTANAIPYAVIGALALALVIVCIIAYNEKRIAERRHRELVDLLRQASGVQSRHFQAVAGGGE